VGPGGVRAGRRGGLAVGGGPAVRGARRPPVDTDRRPGPGRSGRYEPTARHPRSNPIEWVGVSCRCST